MSPTPPVDTHPTDPHHALSMRNTICNSEEHVDFDESSLLKTRPPLGAAEDFHLSSLQVMKIFGINENLFTPIPTRLVVPVLKGHRGKGGGHHTRGWLYILEPQEWSPVVRHGDSVVASNFKSPYSTPRKEISEAEFNSDCKASIEFRCGGSYYGTRTGVTQGGNISFEYSSASVTEEELQRMGVAGDTLVQELVLYPVLRCKAIRKQRIDYTFNETSKELEWAGDSSQPEDRDRVRVPSSHLGRVAQMQFHPVPVRSRGCDDLARLLPIPQVGSGGNFEVTTLLSRTGWTDWYIYEAEFQDCSETVDLAASRNDVAFRPTSCWTTLLDDDEGGELDDEPSPPQGIIDSSTRGQSSDEDERERKSRKKPIGRKRRNRGSLRNENPDHGAVLVEECALEPLDS